MSRFTLYKLNPIQSKKIWAIANEIDISKDNLHLLVYSMTNKEHISDLTKEEADSVIKELERQEESIPRDPNRISKAQIKYAKDMIHKINTEKNWTMKENSLSMKMFSEKLRKLSKKNAGSLIEALKKILERE